MPLDAISRSRVFGLDLARSLAIIGSLTSHTVPLIISSRYADSIDAFAGFYGVELFFVLSGLLIGGILIKTWDSRKQMSFHQVTRFWVRRWFRTLPNYYLMLFVYAATYLAMSAKLIFADYHYLKYLFFTQNAIHPQPWFFGVSWSLAVEEWFYLSFPLILAGLSKVRLPGKHVVLWTVAVVTIVCLTLRIYLALSAPELKWDDSFRKMMPLRLDAISIGVLLAFAKRYSKALWAYLCNRLFWVGVAGSLTLGAYIVIHYGIRHQEGFFLKTFYFTLVSVSLALLLPHLETITTRNRTLIRVVTFVSIVSYSAYLTHPLFLELVAIPAARLGGKMQFVLVWILTFGGSYLLYRFFERPMTDLRERFSSRAEKVRAASA